jgi:hypothetical protein
MIRNIKESKNFLKEDESSKYYYTVDNVGSAKYTVNYYDGKKTHKDGSPFYDMKIFKNKKDLNEFISGLVKKGYKYKK